MSLVQALVIGLAFAVVCGAAAIVAGGPCEYQPQPWPTDACPKCKRVGSHSPFCGYYDEGGPDAA